MQQTNQFLFFLHPLHCWMERPAWLLLHRLALMDLVTGLLHSQAWVGWVTVLGGIRASSVQADRDSPSQDTVVGAWCLLAVGTGHMTVG